MKLEDIIETTYHAPETVWWHWSLIALAALVGLALIVFLVRIFIKRQKPTTLGNPARAAQLAFEQLPQQTNDPKTLAKEASFILRDYLQARFDAPALFQTIEEFEISHAELEVITEEARALTQDFLKRTSQLLYSPENPGFLELELQSICSSGIEIVETCEAALKPRVPHEPQQATP